MRSTETMPNEIRPKIVPTQAGPLEYVDTGKGPVVVALHGAMGGWDQSLILAQAALTGPHRILALSRPGYLGTPLRAGITPEEQADLFASLLDTLGVEKAAVIAISGGGPCALHFGLRHPRRCAGLVLISTCSGIIWEPIPFAFHLMKALAHIPFLVRVMKRKALGNLEKSLARAIADAATRQRLLGEPEVMALYRALMESTFDRMAERIRGTNNDIRITRTRDYPLEAIRVPCLIIHGTHDRVVSFDAHAKRFASRLPEVKLVAVAGGEHVTLFTHREQVRTEVAQFLHR
jgi:pimeloyl-ACP methyl ester carboxylesterase